ncbi:hypothetical protein C1878_03235 [Gordonibacter sp. 28C]|uniref:DUF2326 domain-containing protein n=1 Tax=Gordonibacter sp. 28C TaxID=2078569 RepID=UPI000DF7C9D1|nr:DUF2326 domain-containing protein [Gordonibacter sp. 28C]RDB63824.1 hypothetical protein C1878_03235 [Gordonibacter sp. 28C]
MLKRIKCSLLLEKELLFHDGANFILGDDAASNSIGKTTTLLLIDFAFGGNHYARSDEIVESLGDHEIEAVFIFGGQEYEFIRTTKDPEKVLRVDRGQKETITLNEFKAFLKGQYQLQHTGMGFRDAVGLYSRIWGKRNIDPLKPLNTVPNESGAKSVARLVKLFELYGTVEEFATEVSRLEAEKRSVDQAQKQCYLPQTTKREAKAAEKQIKVINDQIEKLTASLEFSKENMEASFTPEVLRLRNRRSRISGQISELTSRLDRLNASKTTKRSAKAIQRQISELHDFFPSVDMRSVEEIEDFHVSLNEILDQYIAEERKRTAADIGKFQKEIESLDNRFNSIIAGSISSVEIEAEELARLIADRIANEQVLHLYERKLALQKCLNLAKDNEECAYTDAIDEVSALTNKEIKAISSDVIPSSPFPCLNLYQASYDYSIDSDSGTGRAYAALVIFDLAILELTKLPFFIHDSVILKNIEVSALSNIVDRYISVKGRQIFVAIDEISRLDQYERKGIESNGVIKLSEERTLFGDSWKRRGENE